MTPTEGQKHIIDSMLILSGKEPLPREVTEKLIKDTNRRMRQAEIFAYVLGLVLHFTGGAVAGSLLGFPALASGAAVVILRVVLLFDVRKESKGLQLMLAQKLMKSAMDQARVARSNQVVSKDLFPRA